MKLTNFTDFYQILELPPTAQAAEIKQAFRRLAKEYHPDVNPTKQAEEEFKKINEAYEILSSPTKKTEYDQLRKTVLEQQQQDTTSEQNHQTNQPSPPEKAAVNSFHKREQDIELTLLVSFRRALLGGPVEIKYRRFETCNICHGSKKFFQRDCFHCHGLGGLETEVKLKIQLPAALNHHEVLVFAGGGHLFPQSPVGDLFVDCEIKPDPLFSREGNDVIEKVKISPWVAKVGGVIEFMHWTGEKMTTKIPRGVQEGTGIRFRGLGVPPRYSSLPAGDLVIFFQFSPVKNLTWLYRQFQKII